jgi:DNA replication protein DnaC
MITSNRAFKEWPKMFNNDSTLTAAILDRLLHHADTVVIERIFPPNPKRWKPVK